MSDVTAIRGQVDRFATIVETYKTAISGGTDFRHRVDDAADLVYENRIGGDNCTALDAAIAAGLVFSHPTIKTWITDHIAYFTNPTTSNQAGLGLSNALGGWYAYLLTKGFRVPQSFAELYALQFGTKFPSLYVFPKGIRPADNADPATSGMHKFGRFTKGAAATGAWASTAGALDITVVAAAVILAINNQAQGGSALTVPVTCTRRAGTTVDVNVTFAGGDGQYTQKRVGEQVLTGPATAGVTTTLPMAATSQFLADEFVLIYKSDTVQEIAQIETVNAGDIVLKNPVINSYAAPDVVIPLFTNGVGKTASGSAGTNGHTADLFAYPERVVAL
jgi:hypothetical protein